MLCKVCGAQIPDDAQTCEFCGAVTDGSESIEEVNDETKVIDTEEIKNIEEQEAVDEKDEKEEIFDDNERRRREQMQRMMENKKKQLSEIERRRNEKRVKQKRNRIALIALICALAVAAAGYGTYYLLQNVNTNGNTAVTPAPTEMTAVVTSPIPSAEPTAVPSPGLSMTTAPRDASSSQNGQSWTPAGGSSNSSSGSNTSGNRVSSAGSASAGGNGTSASGGASSGSSSSGGTSGGGTSSSTTASVVKNAQASGTTTANIVSQLSVGDEVIYNSGTGRYLMTFVTGNIKYYANVSAGSTTEQIQYKPYTITAAPTAETYNGNTVYEISVMTNYAGDGYVLEYSGTRLLTENDIKGMSKHDLALARNEIYARHGRKFQTAEYRNFFSSKSWYKLNPNYNYSDDNANLNSIEIKNVQFLLSAERR